MALNQYASKSSCLVYLKVQGKLRFNEDLKYKKWVFDRKNEQKEQEITGNGKAVYKNDFFFPVVFGKVAADGYQRVIILAFSPCAQCRNYTAE